MLLRELVVDALSVNSSLPSTNFSIERQLFV